MKRTFALIYIVAVFMIAGCGGDPKTTENPSAVGGGTGGGGNTGGGGVEPTEPPATGGDTGDGNNSGGNSGGDTGGGDTGGGEPTQPPATGGGDDSPVASPIITFQEFIQFADESASLLLNKLKDAATTAGNPVAISDLKLKLNQDNKTAIEIDSTILDERTDKVAGVGSGETRSFAGYSGTDFYLFKSDTTGTSGAYVFTGTRSGSDDFLSFGVWGKAKGGVANGKWDTWDGKTFYSAPDFEGNPPTLPVSGSASYFGNMLSSEVGRYPDQGQQSKYETNISMIEVLLQADFAEKEIGAHFAWYPPSGGGTAAVIPGYVQISANSPFSASGKFASSDISVQLVGAILPGEITSTKTPLTAKGSWQGQFSNVPRGVGGAPRMVAGTLGVHFEGEGYDYSLSGAFAAGGGGLAPNPPQ